MSDLHIGLRLMNHDLSEDQAYILNEITRIACEEKPDAVLIAGDIYDRAVPSAEAVGLFDAFITGLSRALPEAHIMAVSGNHDSAQRLDLYRNVLANYKIHMIGNPPMREGEHIEKVVLSDEYGPVNFYLLPFVKPSMIKPVVGTDENGNNLSYDVSLHRLFELEEIDESERNVLLSHQFYLPEGKSADDIERSESEIKTVGNIDMVRADVLERFDYAALGHIHKPMSVGSDRFRYCGTPLACSIDEAGQQKGLIEIELGEKGDVKTRVIPLISLREVREVKGTLEEVTAVPSDDYVRVTLTDKVDLDVFDMQERIRHAFPHLLEIRREYVRSADYGEAEYNAEEELDPFELCSRFLGDPEDEEEKALLRDVINTVKGA